MAESRDQIIQRYISKYPEETNRKLAQRIVNEGALKGSVDGIRLSIGKLKGVTIKLTDDTKWKVTDEGHYQWETARGLIDLSVEFIDQLFFEYSMHGENLSQTQMLNKHNLAPWQWGSIKSTLMLFKHSNIFSPHTVAITPPELMPDMISKKIQKVFTNIGLQVEHIYDKTLRQEYKKTIEKQAGKDLFYNTILSELQDMFAGQQGPLPKPVIRIQKDSEGVLNAFLFDIHFGAKSEGHHKFSTPYDPEVIEATFSRIADLINAEAASEVHLHFGGDNIESLTGLNHLDAWQGLAPGYYGSRAVIGCYKAYVKFISKVHNVKRIYAVPGNHDRASADNKIDTEGYVAAIIFEMVKLAFGEKIDVLYDDRLISVVIDGICYIMSHGHFKFSNAPAAELIMDYGRPDLYNLLISGHWHTRKVTREHRQFRQIVAPSLIPGNDYSNGLGVSSSAGFLMVKNNGRGKPTVIDYSL